MNTSFCTILLALIAVPGVFAQSKATLLVASQTPPGPMEVAPGQLVTLYFKGVNAGADGRLREARAGSAPLPTQLAGLSARVVQAQLEGEPRVPVLEVRQESQCGGARLEPACILTAMRVQIPFELPASVAGPDGRPILPPPGQLILEEDGQASFPFALQVVPSNAHVVTSCDEQLQMTPRGGCVRLAFHANGRPVSADLPARSGEVITVYALGLGRTVPAGETGKPAASAAPLEPSDFPRVWAVFRTEPLNAAGAAPRFLDAEASRHRGDEIRYAGLAPGYIGTYQLNIVVPPTIRPVLPCGGEIRSNALLMVTTGLGSEGVPLCVAP